MNILKIHYNMLIYLGFWWPETLCKHYLSSQFYKYYRCFNIWYFYLIFTSQIIFAVQETKSLTDLSNNFLTLYTQTVVFGKLFFLIINRNKINNLLSMMNEENCVLKLTEEYKIKKYYDSYFK